MTPEAEKNYCLLTHLLGLSVLVGIPGFIGCLVIWLLKRGESERVDVNGKEALSFQICVLIVEAISVPLMAVFGLGVLTALAAYVIGIVFSIIGAIKVSEGSDYRYPWTYRMIK
ncbi:MAG: DUF4870 domain-containing protein [Verrucomicrobiota bacterium]